MVCVVALLLSQKAEVGGLSAGSSWAELPALYSSEILGKPFLVHWGRDCTQEGTQSCQWRNQAPEVAFEVLIWAQRVLFELFL